MPLKGLALVFSFEHAEALRAGEELNTDVVGEGIGVPAVILVLLELVVTEEGARVRKEVARRPAGVGARGGACLLGERLESNVLVEIKPGFLVCETPLATNRRIWRKGDLKNHKNVSMSIGACFDGSAGQCGTYMRETETWAGIEVVLVSRVWKRKIEPQRLS